MQIKDAEQVAQLALQLGYESSPEDISRRIVALEKNPDAAMFVADMDGVVVGWCTINRERQTLLSEGNAELTAIVVDASHRGKSVGSKLLKSSEEWAKNRGLSLIRLRSNVKREEAHRFYLGAGYSILKSWHCFVKDL
jgi:GNAT superfamily N-acetyltransferase